MDGIRLQKWISELGLASRREAERWITEGRLKINESTAKLGDRVDPINDKVFLDGKKLNAKTPPKIYWMLHKPNETLTSTAKEGDKMRIFDLPKLQKQSFHIFPVGRLDFKTEGLLLMTNDGELCNRLCHPKYKLPRFYQVLIGGKASSEQIKQIRKGIELEDGKVRCEIVPAYGVNLGKSKGSWYFVTVYEGRNRLVRRIFEHFDHKVIRLIRYGFGNLRLNEELKPGDYRQLTSKEIRYLKNSVDIK